MRNIPIHEKIWDEEVLERQICPNTIGSICTMEIFPDRYGKFIIANYRKCSRYNSNSRCRMKQEAKKTRVKKVSRGKESCRARNQDYIGNGGIYVAMCFSNTDSYDIALAAENVDILAMSCTTGILQTRNAQSKLDFSKTVALKILSWK